jgi:hypothetical protein
LTGAATDLPFSQAAENNRGPILAELPRLLGDARSVLEIGAGTGQHAVAFSGALPALQWQPTEHPDALPWLRPRCMQQGPDNLLPPRALDILAWPADLPWADALYTANTFHIVAAETVQALFAVCAERGTAGSRLIVYGPFNYDGAFTSASNEQFDGWLRARDSASGIRDFEWVNGLAEAAGYRLVEDIAMPANNRLLCWEKHDAVG